LIINDIVQARKRVTDMLFRAPELDDHELQVMQQIRQARETLRYQLMEPRRWTGLLRRVSFARAIRASNSIEGYNVSLDDALAAVEDDDPMEIDRQAETWAAVVAYRDAMTYCLQIADDPYFAWSVDLVRALHYMMLRYDLAKMPGRWRPGPIYVVDEQRSERVYEGPDAEAVPSLMDEFLMDLLNEDEPPTIRAAMAHLNLAMIHPFKDGNGRMARALQTLVLAREGILAPQLSSVEEYLGKNTRAYYDVLAQVGSGSWSPQRDARPWIRFMLTAHYKQAMTLRRRTREFSLVWDAVEDRLSQSRLPDRAVPAVAEAALGARIRRSRYTALTDVEDATASRDLRALTDAGLFEAHGEKRGRYYLASDALRNMRRQIREQVSVPILDPFSELEGQTAMRI
jgi:Fic family protein